MELLKPREAAAAIRISYPTLKQWIYRGRIRSIRTPGGHHRIPRSEVERLTRSSRSGQSDIGISGRNKLRGKVTDIRFEGLLAQVTLDIGSQTVTSIITRNAAEELGLKKGVAASALIKATEVMILREGSKRARSPG